MNESRLGYYFARIQGSDEITVVSCWGDKIVKDTPKDVEILEQIPHAVLKFKTRVLNLQRIRERD